MTELRMSPADRIEELGTSTLSDALDWAGLGGQSVGLKPLRPGMRLAGRAYTVRYQPCDLVPGTVGDFIDDVAPGAVVVIDNGGRLDATVWGDILTWFASARGIAGTVIDGVNRDYDRAAELSYPIFSRGTYMRTGKDRVEVAAIEEPVNVSGHLVRPGDLIVGDSDGVVVIPAEREQQVLDRAWTIHRTEQQIRDAIAAGMSLREARAQYGYHSLQTRPTPSADRNSADGNGADGNGADGNGPVSRS
jgi:4-hydroxy-4-methyl-2-oxoglutarate aldolase